MEQQQQLVYVDMSTEYSRLTNDIRNMRTLTPAQIDLVGRLPKYQLLELIEIYNRIVDNVSYVLS